MTRLKRWRRGASRYSSAEYPYNWGNRRFRRNGRTEDECVAMHSDVSEKNGREQGEVIFRSSKSEPQRRKEQEMWVGGCPESEGRLG